MNTNDVNVSGEVTSQFRFNHESYGEKFFSSYLNIRRKSGIFDIVPIMVSERLLDMKQDYEGKYIHISGQFRSYNWESETGNHLLVFVFAQEVALIENGNEVNEIFLEGYICKPTIYRKTPLGREVADLLLAVNRPYGKSDYIPCICWGRNARYSSNLKIGNKIRITGRIQSREYIKRMEDEKRIAFEVSISQMEVVESEECKDQVADAE